MGKEEDKEKKKKRIPRGRRNREPRDRLVKEKELNDEEDQVTNTRSSCFSCSIIRHTRENRYAALARLPLGAGASEQKSKFSPENARPLFI
jgi:hypothetical protein